MARTLLLILIGATLLGAFFTVAFIDIFSPQYEVSGKVFLCDSTYGTQPGGVPVSGVRVKFARSGGFPSLIIGSEDTTDFEGTFSVILKAGTYSVYAEAERMTSFNGKLIVDGPISDYNQICVSPLANA